MGHILGYVRVCAGNHDAILRLEQAGVPGSFFLSVV